jgi:hypothetical protein
MLLLSLVACACEIPDNGDLPEGDYANPEAAEVLRVKMDATLDLVLGCTVWQSTRPIGIQEGLFSATMVTEDGEFEAELNGTMCDETIEATMDGRELVLELDEDFSMWDGC